MSEFFINNAEVPTISKQTHEAIGKLAIFSELNMPRVGISYAGEDPSIIIPRRPISTFWREKPA